MVLAVRNEERYLAEAVASVLRQAEVALEVVIVNDNSTDATADIAKSISANHDNVILLENPRPGKANAFNYGVDAATGDFICLFAGDDDMPKGSLSQRLHLFDAVDPNLPVVSLAKILTMSEDRRFDGVLVPKAPGVGNPSGGSIMMNRKAAEIIFPVPASLPSEDSWMALAISLHPSLTVLHTDVVACKWRVHEGNTSGNMTEDFETYSKKIGDRNQALWIFRDRFHDELDSDRLAKLDAAIHCELMRRQGNVLGILASDLPVKERLRSLSSSNALFYGIRRKLYSSLSGRG